MKPEDQAEEEQAAIDALFEEGVGIPLKAEPPPPPEPELAVRPLPPGSAPSPLKDYVRELQQEFAEEQEKGKL